MSLGDRIGPMIKCVFALLVIFVLSIVFSIVWSSIFLYLVNNPFMVQSNDGLYLRNTVSVVVGTSSGAFILLTLMCIFFYFCGSHFYLHFTTIFLVAACAISCIVFLAQTLLLTTEKKQNNYIQFYSAKIRTNTTRKTAIADWMEEHNCTTCENELSTYFNIRCFVGFIVTSVNILIMMMPIISLIILISLMGCIKPDDVSEDPGNVPSELVQTLIDTRRCLSEGIMTGKFRGYNQV